MAENKSSKGFSQKFVSLSSYTSQQMSDIVKQVNKQCISETRQQIGIDPNPPQPRKSKWASGETTTQILINPNPPQPPKAKENLIG